MTFFWLAETLVALCCGLFSARVSLILTLDNNKVQTTCCFVIETI